MNRKLKKSITMILTLLLLLSSVPSYGAAARFKDVPKTHWSYSYVEDMSKLGYLSGYPNGTFGPSGNLTFLESMSALSRFSKPTSAEKKDAMSGYAYLLNELKINEAWEREGISIALHKGIISENELRNAKEANLFNKPIQRQVISVFLAKAMGLEQRAKDKDIIKLPFNDSGDVDSSRVRYVDVLLDVKVLSPEGKGGKMFEPKATLTRAEMATLLSKGHDYLLKNPIGDLPKEPESVEIETIKSSIKRITDETGRKILVIENKFGEEEGYIIESNTSISVDGKSANVSSLTPGQVVELKVERGKNTIRLVSIKATSIEEDAIGTIKKISSSNLNMTLEYKDGSKVLSRDYTIDSNAKINLDGKSAYLKDLKEGSLVEIKSNNNKVYEIKATSEILKVEGIIKELSPISDSKDSYYIVTLLDKDEVTHKFYTDSQTKIYRKNKTANEKDLNLKDFAYIKGEYDLKTDSYLANEIDADVDVRKIKGNVTQITNSINKNTLVTIKDWDKGVEETYELTRNAYISVDNKVVSSLPRVPGYYVDVVLENDEIVEIYVDSTSLETSIVGKIRTINYDRGIIELEIDNINHSSGEYGKELTIYTDSKVIVSDRKLAKLSFRDLYRGQMINVVGTKDGANFVADTIQIR